MEEGRSKEKLVLLQIYLCNTDGWEGKPLYEVIVDLLRKRGFRGATVLRALAAYGASDHEHPSRAFHVLEEVSLVIRVLERAERIGQVMPLLNNMMTSGLITITETDGIFYRASSG